MVNWILQYWIEVCFGAVAGLCGYALKLLNTRVRKIIEEERTERNALLALLDDAMGELYDKCHKKGYRTHEEVRRFNRVYDAYHALGGNGAGTEEMRHFNQLDIRKDDYPHLSQS